MKYSKFYLVCALLFPGGLSAAPDGEKFHFNGEFLFNATSEANTTDTDFKGDNGLAGYIGYNIQPWLSVELGGVKFDPIESRRSFGSTVARTEHEVTGYTLGFRGVYSFYDLFDVWGSVGVYSWESTFNYELTYDNFPTVRRTGSNSNSSEDSYIRLGVTLPLTENLGVSAGLAQFELKDFFSGVPDDEENTNFRQRYIGLGVDYYF